MGEMIGIVFLTVNLFLLPRPGATLTVRRLLNRTNRPGGTIIEKV